MIKLVEEIGRCLPFIITKNSMESARPAVGRVFKSF